MQFSHVSATQGQWIIDSCATADQLTVVAQVPVGYERYARILHPAYDEFDQPVKWGTVASSRGHILTAADLFETVAGWDAQGNPAAEDAWEETDLPVDELPVEQWQALVKQLRAATEQEKFVVGLWGGYAFIEGGERIQIENEPDPELSDEENQAAHAAALAEAQRPAFAPEVLTTPALELGGGYRNYRLFEVDGEFLAQPLWATTVEGPQRQRPALAFPEDRSWMLSTEPYDDCTLIGGSAELIEAILRDPLLEAIEVGQFTRIGHSN
ncbi:hypothetical protein CQ010_02645 [Arthrobacter sp. MYb211]|uniref:hypothetical protein n=1 Tax=Micrococcaceae TaxID=1268 RepID=UPI000BB8F2EE|nr:MULTISPECIES: hypothetical protein [Micrococcaceae]PCC29488.1 hypothetical protein CIK76_06525 [Glutamicibacter sp. BW80]PRA01514.1 hypothetical protein CQ017_03235 [Arthrobacter sp. MYb224]PRA06295.1 hypothetical protein CQ019_02545 [Arthrobacter sp. MYb229]PRA12769.1 hypothetical protein CQ015_05885 [Arthrobacter sp. MYb221]PRB53197.1 hypothetical protein CQ013_02545 [Arthrobacter sp. MYb216]